MSFQTSKWQQKKHSFIKASNILQQIKYKVYINIKPVTYGYRISTKIDQMTNIFNSASEYKCIKIVVFYSIHCWLVLWDSGILIIYSFQCWLFRWMRVKSMKWGRYQRETIVFSHWSQGYSSLKTTRAVCHLGCLPFQHITFVELIYSVLQMHWVCEELLAMVTCGLGWEYPMNANNLFDLCRFSFSFWNKIVC